MPWQAGRNARSLIHLQRVADPLRLRLLTEVGARGSISAAAEACTIGQPSASLHLRHLESAVGCRLIERGTTGSRLTPEGEIVRLHAASVLSSLEAMLDDLSAQQTGTRGALAIAASTAASYLVAPALTHFADRYPDVDVTVRVSNSAGVHAMVRRREVAFGIAGPVPASAGIACEHVLDDEVVGIAAPGVCDRGPRVPAAALARCTLLVRQPGSGQQLAAERVLESLPPGLDFKTLLLDSEEAVKGAVRARLGVAFVSRLAIRDEASRGEVVAFRLEGMPPMHHPLHAARRASAHATSVQQTFVDALAAAGRGGVAVAPDALAGNVALLPARSAAVPGV
jgi:DNA-binding transcriptional LysR family regulator